MVKMVRVPFLLLLSSYTSRSNIDDVKANQTGILTTTSQPPLPHFGHYGLPICLPSDGPTVSGDLTGRLEQRKCKDPFGSICDNSGCRCRDGYPIQVDGVCLKNVTNIGEPCWVSDQCRSIEHSACIRSSGRVLEEVFDPLWEAFVRSNRSEKFIPGKCACSENYKVFTKDDGSKTCIHREIGSRCMTSYECARKVRYSLCSQKDRKCVCPETGYRYSPHTDECIPLVKSIPVADCSNDGSCSVTAPGGLTDFSISEMSTVIGFGLSMIFILGVWFVFFKLTNSRSQSRTAGTDGNFSAFYGIDDDDTPPYPPEDESEEVDEFEIDPPSYEEVTNGGKKPSARDIADAEGGGWR